MQVRALGGRQGDQRKDPEESCSLTFNPSMLLDSPPAFVVDPDSPVDRDDANIRMIEDKTAQDRVLTDISVP